MASRWSRCEPLRDRPCRSAWAAAYEDAAETEIKIIQNYDTVIEVWCGSSRAMVQRALSGGWRATGRGADVDGTGTVYVETPFGSLDSAVEAAISQPWGRIEPARKAMVQTITHWAATKATRE